MITIGISGTGNRPRASQHGFGRRTGTTPHAEHVATASGLLPGQGRPEDAPAPPEMDPTPSRPGPHPSSVHLGRAHRRLPVPGGVRRPLCRRPRPAAGDVQPRLLHLSGITPALSDSCLGLIRALLTAPAPAPAAPSASTSTGTPPCGATATRPSCLTSATPPTCSSSEQTRPKPPSASAAMPPSGRRSPPPQPWSSRTRPGGTRPRPHPCPLRRPAPHTERPRVPNVRRPNRRSAARAFILLGSNRKLGVPPDRTPGVPGRFQRLCDELIPNVRQGRSLTDPSLGLVGLRA